MLRVQRVGCLSVDGKRLGSVIRGETDPQTTRARLPEDTSVQIAGPLARLTAADPGRTCENITFYNKKLPNNS